MDFQISAFRNGNRLFLSLFLLLGGCSAHPIWVAGHTADYAEVFEGQGTSDGAASNFVVVGSPSGIRCRGKGTNTFAGLQGSWTESLECDDGRTATFPIGLPSGTNWFDGSAVWFASATFSDGTSFSMVQSSKTESEIKARLASYLKKQRQAGRDTVAAMRRPEPPSRASVGATSRPPPPPTPVRGAAARFPRTPLALTFRPQPPRPDDIAVIIGNANYSKHGIDIPDVVPAYADAEGFKRFATDALGISEDNIIFITDATQTRMISTFGSKDNHKGQLYNWVEPGESNVYVYYSGHGAPGGGGGGSYLVPTDANASTIELNGYALQTLYGNLGKIPARSVTVVLEACFSGASEGGAVISNASPVFMKAKAPPIPPNVTVIAAGAANQIASWEKDKSHGRFTKYFLKGMAGGADASPYGNGDGRVGWPELERYLKKTLTRFARRYYGRDQRAQIVVGKGG